MSHIRKLYCLNIKIVTQLSKGSLNRAKTKTFCQMHILRIHKDTKSIKLGSMEELLNKAKLLSREMLMEEEQIINLNT